MFKFHTIPVASLPKKVPKTSTIEKSLDEKFEEMRRRIWIAEKRKLREFHYIAIEHEGFLVVFNGYKKEVAKIEINGNKHKAVVQARADVYVEAIRENEETQGGCCFDLYT